jgi:hypothetical protein
MTLDLATVTGHAFGIPGETITYGSTRMGHPGASPGAKLHAFREWFWDFTEAHRPLALVFEAPFNLAMMSRTDKKNKFMTNEATIRFLFGIVAVAEEAAIARRIEIIKEVGVQDVRAHFVGQRTFRQGGREAAKKATIARCYQLGWTPIDDNCADALAIWSYAESIFSPRTSAQRQVNAMRGLRA